MSEIDWQNLPPFVCAAALFERTGGSAPARGSESIGSLEPGTGDLVIADVRWSVAEGSLREDYLEAHIPGAIFVDLEHDLTGEGAPERGRHPFPDDDELSEKFSALGINFEDTVVCYGAGDPMGAARLALMLRFVGVNAAVLDGGLAAYVREAGENALESGEVWREPSDFPWQPYVRLVSEDEVQHAIPTKGALLIDARPPARYRGDSENLDPRPGHIPTAKNVPFTSLLEADGTFRSPEEIRTIFERAGATTERITFNYCGSGVSAAVNTLAMDYAGFAHVYLYAGSYSEWSRNPERAVETGEEEGSDAF
ncbi:sulfurtransferase [Dermabacter sp. p3-SID358]|uniref:sulfurtransferase n=1 Tax=Dermabacter sp. p3-SID358 TaxID=2916114 RepID=UPI0021A3B84E|nr:sulfurtransferase [Dermabacter sp. p3-SID358]MCT1867081.1 sulfurtransferase [Dermabacter sp. p3-SID358]